MGVRDGLFLPASTAPAATPTVMASHAPKDTGANPNRRGINTNPANKTIASNPIAGSNRDGVSRLGDDAARTAQ